MKMSKTRRILQVPWYPLLFPVIPVFSLFVINRAELSALDLLRPVLIALLMGAGFLAVSYIFTRTGRKAALASIILILGTLLYDYVYLLLLSFTGLSYSAGLFLPVWVGLAFLIYVVVCVDLRRRQWPLADPTIVLNVFAFSILAIAGLPATLDLLQQRTNASFSDPESISAAAWRQSLRTDWSEIERPDIYYLILDAYARQDILQSRFNFDNGDFLDWLSSVGFFVATRSHANYPATHFSLAATLNAEYLQQLVSRDLLVGAPEANRAKQQYLVSRIADNYINNSRVHELLRLAGYQLISNDSGYRVTRRIPDSLGEALVRNITEYERELLQLTALYPVLNNSEGSPAVAMSMSELILRDFRALTLSEPGTVPTYYFYHFLCPHFPFSFNEDGSKRLRHPVFGKSAWIQDRINLPGYLDYYRQNYPGNVAGLNYHLKTTIESILERTDGKAVIIIQSDHGSSLGYVPGSTTESDIAERFGILNAIFLPEKFSRSALTDDFSAINTFPIVFESIFGLGLPKLEDRAFMSTGHLEFTDVTDLLHEQEM